MKTANDAAVILYEIAAKIRSLEGMPVDYGLALELSSVLNRIESSVDSPSSASAPSGEISEKLWDFMEQFIGPTGGWLVSPKKLHAALVTYMQGKE